MLMSNQKLVMIKLSCSYGKIGRRGISDRVSVQVQIRAS